MTLARTYLDYSKRRPGLDHDRFDYRRLLRTDLPATWPNGKLLALSISIYVEYFPMDMPREPILPPGGMQRPGTSFWDYTLRDYGNRVAIFRLMKALGSAGMRATAAFNSEAARRYPMLVEEAKARGWEVAACGVDMGQLHYGDMDEARERALIEQSRQVLCDLSGQPVHGWYSPGNTQSKNTQRLVTEAGFEYLSDWANDDLAYWLTSSAGRIVSMPLNLELSDRRFLFEQNQPLDEWERRSIIGIAYLCQEAEKRGIRQTSLNLTPWIIAQPYRIASLKRVLAAIAARDEIWVATTGEIAAAWKEFGE
ncbi:polysaccharide deacetylase family protein [Tropicimonas isoalkanivorans]|uniref:Chitooligosaccharide deacetylase n=1 Tax=Tropicimonas isoalkanivorans TaxID=441112 RepID=A0A1I1KPX5_9RHOB|nr:polysaccharide deacetylase family protein [Tropicimonas isoalkanivorans]SFC62906.1 Polysaccharide deacetylase [Tropicimonas isoalkanivorans]